MTATATPTVSPANTSPWARAFSRAPPASDARPTRAPSRAPMSRDEALAVLRHGAARQWDPMVVEALEHLPPELWRLWEDAREHAAKTPFPGPPADAGPEPPAGRARLVDSRPVAP